jgi:hypothetical protein
VRLKPETKKRKLKSALDRIRETLCKLNRRIVIPQNNDEVVNGSFSIDYESQFYVCNVDENSAVNGNKYVDQIHGGKG